MRGLPSSINEPRDVGFRERIEQSRRTRRGARLRRACRQRRDDQAFSRVRRDQRDLVDPLFLTQAIDSTGTLLEPSGIPRQFVVDDKTAVMLQVEPFRCRIRRQQRMAATIEGVRRARAVAWTQATVQEDDRSSERNHRSLDLEERVTVLGKDDGRFGECGGGGG